MRRALVLLAALALPAAAAAPEGTLKAIQETGSITIGHRDASIPFSYYDERQRPIGYAIDICHRIVDAVKRELDMPSIDIKYQLVTPANRIPLLANGTIDIECGSTTNNVERQKRVAYTNTHFVAANRFVALRKSKVRSLADLKGKTVVSTAGTTNFEGIARINTERNIGMRIVPADGHPESFLMVETGRAAAFFMDDILLRGLVATSKNPKAFVISEEAYSIEPYGIMVRKGDPAFKKLADDATARLYKSGEINALYDKWFRRKIPPRGVNLDVPMSPQLKNALAYPTDSPDPNDYK